MKVLLDTCINIKVYQSLLAKNIDVEWTGNWQPDPGAEVIRACAYQNQRILVTLKLGAIITADQQRVRSRDAG